VSEEEGHEFDEFADEADDWPRESTPSRGESRKETV
jgi:hypothetical protein